PGWTRYIFEHFDFPFELVYPKTLDGGDLSAKYDVLVFPSGIIPPATFSGGTREGRGGRGTGGGGGRGSSRGADIPVEFQEQLGSITAQQTLPQLRKFLEDGGTIVAVGQSTVLARALGLPVENHLVERSADGTDRPLPREKYYVPGSVLRIA